MERANQQNEPARGGPIGDVLGVANLIKILGQVEYFLGWLEEYHHLHESQALLSGYRFALLNLFRMLDEQIIHNSSLGLSEDIIFRRALFAGISLHKVPNTCDKAILLKNIRHQEGGVGYARSWSDLSKAFSHFSQVVLSAFDRLEAPAEVAPEHSVGSPQEAVRYASIFQVYLFLNDTYTGIPHALLLGDVFGNDRLLGKRQTREFPQAFEGYKYAVQFLWFRLLGEAFYHTPLTKMHEASDWALFDQFFEIVRQEVITPLETMTGLGAGFDSLLVLKDPAAGLLSDLISIHLPEPRLSPLEEVDRLFLWYDVELIDASDYMFRGAPSLVPMLVGLVQSKQSPPQPEKAHVIRITHPNSTNRREFSYAILIEVYGLWGLSDYSGWLLFYDCCSDRGSGASSHKLIEEQIQRYLDADAIELKERTLGKEEFLRTIAHRLTKTSRTTAAHILREKKRSWV